MAVAVAVVVVVVVVVYFSVAPISPLSVTPTVQVTTSPCYSIWSWSGHIFSSRLSVPQWVLAAVLSPSSVGPFLCHLPSATEHVCLILFPFSVLKFPCGFSWGVRVLFKYFFPDPSWSKCSRWPHRVVIIMLSGLSPFQPLGIGIPITFSCESWLHTLRSIYCCVILECSFIFMLL